MIFFVYIDWTKEIVPRAFYVGKGQIARIRKVKRNIHWKNIASKYGWEREVVFATKNEDYAFLQEILGILELGTFENGTLGRWGANKTAGGEGTVGRVTSEEQRKWISDNNPAKRDDVKEKLRRVRLSAITPDETKQKMSSTHKKLGLLLINNPAHDPEVRARWSFLRKGKNTGSANPASKLTWEKVREIRSLKFVGWSRIQLAELFHVSVHSITKITSNKSWIEL